MRREQYQQPEGQILGMPRFVSTPREKAKNTDLGKLRCDREPSTTRPRKMPLFPLWRTPHGVVNSVHSSVHSRPTMLLYIRTTMLLLHSVSLLYIRQCAETVETHPTCWIGHAIGLCIVAETIHKNVRSHHPSRGCCLLRGTVLLL